MYVFIPWKLASLGSWIMLNERASIHQTCMLSEWEIYFIIRIHSFLYTHTYKDILFGKANKEFVSLSSSTIFAFSFSSNKLEHHVHCPRLRSRQIFRVWRDTFPFTNLFHLLHNTPLSKPYYNDARWTHFFLASILRCYIQRLSLDLSHHWKHQCFATFIYSPTSY